MNRAIKLCLVIVVIVAIGIFGFIERPRTLTQSDLPRDIPIITGKITSIRATTSDDFTRGMEIVVETNVPLETAVKYYTEEFTNRGIRGATMPLFQGTSTEMVAIGETSKHNQLVVSIKSENQATIVALQVKGNSILFLPN